MGGPCKHVMGEHFVFQIRFLWHTPVCTIRKDGITQDELRSTIFSLLWAVKRCSVPTDKHGLSILLRGSQTHCWTESIQRPGDSHLVAAYQDRDPHSLSDPHRGSHKYSPGTTCCSKQSQPGLPGFLLPKPT